MAYIVLNSIFLIAYLLSAAVQYNDPDSLRWIIVYLAASVMCIAWFRHKLPRWYPPLLLVVSLVWIGTLLPTVVGQVSLAEMVESISMKTKSVEEAREIGGLLLVAIWSGFLMQRRR